MARLPLTFLVWGFFILSSGVSAKFFSKKSPFYVMVRIPEGGCSSTVNQMTMTGQCVMSMNACTGLNGTAIGTCAQGYGICCSATLDCSTTPQTVQINGTHLVNPPSLGNQTSCQYLFPRPKGVCQLRLDFNKFETYQGDEPILGDCQGDTLSIVGAANAQYMGPLCGNLTGQHMYLDYGDTSLIKLFSYIAEATNQTWDIQVTYIKCKSPELAPPGCLQYYTDLAGTVKSFNYPNQQQLNNEDYSVCIKSQPGMNKITWSTCGGFEDFFVSYIPPIESPSPEFPPITNPLSGNDCPYDWVMIYGVNKYCGNAFDGPVTSTTQPFVMQVHFNEWEIAPPDQGDGSGTDDSNTGFCLQYLLSP